MKEAAILKIHIADKEQYLAVNWETKGGRNRVIPINTNYQRDVSMHTNSFVDNPNNSVTPKNYNFKQWKNHYYYACHQAGISRKDGITSYGLRHERLNEIYHDISGQSSPIKGGDANSVDPLLYDIACQEIVEVAGFT